MVKINFENNVTKANADTFNTMQDNIENAINNVSIDLDNAVSTSSTNGVENQAITNYVDGKILDAYSTSSTSTYSCDYINNHSGSVDTYSTTETLTNKVWIDSKPIYRKVINIGSRTYSAGNNDIAHNISNIETITEIIFEIKKDDMWWERWDNIYNISVSSTNFRTYFNSSAQVQDSFVIIEYTKSS